MEFKIEKNIPFPIRGRWQELANEMEHGDSILLSHQDSLNLMRAFRNLYARKGEFTCVRSQISPSEFRVWKRKVNKYKMQHKNGI
jgi:hypothetical protein